jgi:hypothetical protein
MLSITLNNYTQNNKDKTLTRKKVHFRGVGGYNIEEP